MDKWGYKSFWVISQDTKLLSNFGFSVISILLLINALHDCQPNGKYTTFILVPSSYF